MNSRTSPLSSNLDAIANDVQPKLHVVAPDTRAWHRGGTNRGRQPSDLRRTAWLSSQLAL